MSFLQLEGLEKTWPDGTRAVRGIELSVECGEFLVLLGPSGCGKTTSLRMTAGLEQPSAGRIVLAGRDVTRLAPAERDVGMVFQFYALYPHMSVAENIAFPLLCAGLARRERKALAAQTAEELGLGALLALRPRELSGGDQQRVALARAMVRDPKLWLMDEPLGTLDAARRSELCEFLRARQLERKVTTLYVTHDQDEAMRLADRVVVMDGGAILQAGPPADVYAQPANLFVARFMGSPGMNLLRGVQVSDSAGTRLVCDGGLEFALPTLQGRPRELVLGVRPEFVRVEPASPTRGRVLLDAFEGSHRHLHLETAAGRLVLRRAALELSSVGSDLGFAFDPRGLCLFDARSGARVA